MKFFEVRKLLEEIVTSMKFSSKIRNQKKVRNPEIRELIEDFQQKKRKKVNNDLKNDNINMQKIIDSYEYKTFEFNKKL